LQWVNCPTLLLVGGLDTEVLRLNREVTRLMLNPGRAQTVPEVRLTVVPGATHLFEEPGALEAVARHAVQWFEQHLHVRH
jgi:putative phosphoribosyl transferase